MASRRALWCVWAWGPLTLHLVFFARVAAAAGLELSGSIVVGGDPAVGETLGSETAALARNSDRGLALRVYPAAPGDVNGDGAIDQEDVELIEGHILWRTPLTGDQVARADTNQDGEIDIADVIWTASHYTIPTPTASPTPSSSPTPSPSPSPTPITLILPGNVPLDLVRIPAGSFQMGSRDAESGHEADEVPVHPVTIAHDFYMGRTEVTQQQWLAVMGHWPDSFFYPGNPLFPCGAGDTYPAYWLAWNDIADKEGFLETLNQYLANSGQGLLTVRLPSEAEWEYACRAGTQTRFFFGDSLTVSDDCENGPAGTLPGNRSDYMWYCGNNGASGTPDFGSKPVATKEPNGFGLYDMSGNIWEWCQDWYGGYSSSAQTDPTGPPSGSYRVARGGGWSGLALCCRSAHRSGYAPGSSWYFIGFRLAAPVP